VAEKTCVACAETIKFAAKLCRFCGTVQQPSPDSTDGHLSGADQPGEGAVGKAKTPRKAIVLSAIVAGVLVATSAVGAIAWQATGNNTSQETAEPPSQSSTSSSEGPTQTLPPPRPQAPEPEPEPPPPPPKSPQEILAEEHAAEMKRACDVVVFYDWNSMDASWGNRGHWKDVYRAYDEIDAQVGRVVSFFDFSMQYDRTMDALLHYGQMAKLWEEIDVYTSWEVATPANRFNDNLNILWRMCGY
jgi:hypothetical protein